MVAKIDEELWFGRSEGEDSIAEESAAISMAARIGRIVGAKTFPRSAKRLAELTRDDRVRIEPVVGVLESDPALSAKLLRLVNSAGYGLRMRCTSVRHAATLVGTDRLHQIATTAAVLDMFEQDSLVAARVIEHSTVVGALSRYLGAHLALPTDDLFTCGFLHDIGKLMMLETEGDLYLDLLEEYEHSPDEMHVLERDMYGFDHAVLAAHVLKAWEIPDPVPKVVAFHHSPARAYKSAPAVAAMVQTLRLADALFYALEEQGKPEAVTRIAQGEAASYLEISEPQLAALWPELQSLREHCLDQARNEPLPVFGADSLRPRGPLLRQRSLEPGVRNSGSPDGKLGLSGAAQLSAGIENNFDRVALSEAPKQLSCVACGEPTFGNMCPACGGHVCPDHQSGREDWCSICREEFERRDAEVLVPVATKAGLATGASAVLAMVFALGGATVGFASVSLLALATLVGVVLRNWHVRRTFLRSRHLSPPPAPPLLMTSMVPPPVVIPSLGQVGSLLALLKPPPQVSIRTLEDLERAESFPSISVAPAASPSVAAPSIPSPVGGARDSTDPAPAPTAADSSRAAPVPNSPRPANNPGLRQPEVSVANKGDIQERQLDPTLSVHPYLNSASVVDALKRAPRKGRSEADLPSVLKSIPPDLSGPSSSAATWPPEALPVDSWRGNPIREEATPEVAAPLESLGQEALDTLQTKAVVVDSVAPPTEEPVEPPTASSGTLLELGNGQSLLPAGVGSQAVIDLPATSGAQTPLSPELSDSLVALVAERVAAVVASRVADMLVKQVVEDARDRLVEVVSRKVADAWRPPTPTTPPGRNSQAPRTTQAPERVSRARYRAVAGRREPPQ